MLTFTAFVVVLGPLIFFHELGHFVAAKLSNVRVEEFGVGWPPRLLKLWSSPSRLTVGSTPIITPANFQLPQNLQVGQYLDVITSPKQQGDYTLRELRVLNPKTDDLRPKREATHQGVHMRGVLTDLDLGTVYSLNWIPLGGFCRMTGEEDPSDPRSLAAQPKRHRLAVLLSGPAMNLLIAILLFSLAFFNGIPEPVNIRVMVREVASGSPAEEAQLQAGDLILETDGIIVKDTRTLQEYINARPGQTVELTLERDGAQLKQPVQVGASDGRVGIVIANWSDTFIVHRSPLPEALAKGLDQFQFSVGQMLRLPAMLIRGQVSTQEVKPVGPVGISQMAGDAIELSNEQGNWFTVLYFAGAISMALGLSNLLPLPALDGGRTLFVLIEALRGRRIDPAKESVFHLIGMALLVGLMLILTIQELVNPVASPF
ncbi:MAG: M50 family metallopeptidase [Anaerolineae bacterium]|jgi:regulator of sigma E protease